MIENFRVLVQKVLPTVYDDSLSYYELLNKVVHYLNNTIDQVNVLSDGFTSVLETVMPENVERVLNEWVDNGIMSQLINIGVLGSKASESDMVLVKQAIDQIRIVSNEAKMKAESMVSGTPKGVYATLELLQTAFPTGETGVYIVTEDGKWYYWDNSSWVSGGTYQTSGIVDSSIAIEKLQNVTLYRNLFNKKSITKGVYVDYTTGQTPQVSGYNASDWITVKPLTKYSKNIPHQLAFYNAENVYISGLPNDIHTFTTPVNCTKIRMTVVDADVQTAQLEESDVVTNTTEYQNVISQVVLPRKHNVYEVAKSGGNFKSINDGIYYVSMIKPIEGITLHINSGKYDEVITLLKGDQKISLIGVNKKDTIIINRTGDYYNSPLQCAGEQYFKNLSFISNHDGVEELPLIKGYAVHSDYNFSGEMVFEDCYFESMQNAALGIGMFGNQKMIFKNCKFYKDSIYDGGSVYIHNAVASGVVNQKMEFINCEIYAKNGNALNIDDANIGSGDGLGNDCELTFINCTVYSEEKGIDCIKFNTPSVGEKTLAGRIKLSPKSHGNNIDILNY